MTKIIIKLTMINNKTTIEECQKFAQSKGGICLSLEYKTNRTKMLWQCKNKHQWWASYNNIKDRGSWCPTCALNNKYTLTDCKNIAALKNGNCLSTEYKNKKEKLLWQCSNNHKWMATFDSIKNQNNWCPHCKGLAKLTLEQCHQTAIDKNGKCLSTKYLNIKSKMLWECEKGHQWESSYDNIKNRNHWCPKCSTDPYKTQREIELFIQAMGLKTIFNDRQQIKPLELDIYIPEKRIAIEYCGLYWHGEEKCGDNAKNKHLKKMLLCRKNGIRLITIFENEWITKNEQVEYNLKQILSEHNVKITGYFSIKQLSTATAKQFHNKYNMFGYDNKIHIGLCCNEALLMVASFIINKNTAILSRFTTAAKQFDYKLSEVIKFFIEKNKNITHIVSYIDNRWDDGSHLKSAGFSFIQAISPSDFYFKHHKLKLFKEKPDNVNKYDRIWDCGSSKFILII